MNSVYRVCVGAGNANLILLAKKFIERRKNIDFVVGNAVIFGIVDFCLVRVAGQCIKRDNVCRNVLNSLCNIQIGHRFAHIHFAAVYGGCPGITKALFALKIICGYLLHSDRHCHEVFGVVGFHRGALFSCIEHDKEDGKSDNQKVREDYERFFHILAVRKI